MMLLTQFRLLVSGASIHIALEGLHAHRVRAWLSVLGIAVGVAPVLIIVAVMMGVQAAVQADVGPGASTRFLVQRADSSEDDGSPQPRSRPITLREIERMTALPELRSVTPVVDASTELAFGTVQLKFADVYGTGADWPDALTGDFLAGRNFVDEEVKRAANVVVISAALAGRLAPERNVVGEAVTLEGMPFRIIGVYRERSTLSSDTSAVWVRTPASTALRYLDAETDWLEALAVPSDNVLRTQAEDAVVSSLRATRGLRTGQPNDFKLVADEGMLELFDAFSGMIFGVMVAIAGLGLLVGSIGVVSIQTISVSERASEIGLRRAMGARRADILRQFLGEALMITLAGGIIGLAVGAGAAVALRHLTPVPATVPFWSAIITLALAAASGICLGLYPALKAARLSPIEALRRQ